MTMTMNLCGQHSDNIWKVVEDLGNEHNSRSPPHWANYCSGKGGKDQQNNKLDQKYNYQHIVNSLYHTYSAAEAVVTVPKRLGNRILGRFTIPGSEIILEKISKHKNSPVSTMKGLTSIRCTRLPGWVCNATINDQWNWSVKYCHIFTCKILPGIIKFILLSSNVLTHIWWTL